TICGSAYFSITNFRTVSLGSCGACAMTGAAARTKASKSRFTLVSSCFCNPINHDVGVVRHHPDQYRFNRLGIRPRAPVMERAPRYTLGYSGVLAPCRRQNTSGKTDGATVERVLHYHSRRLRTWP